MTEALPLGAALIRTATAVGERVLAARAESGLSALQLQVLRLASGGPTMSDVATRLGLSKSTATSLVDQLAAAGLVERTEDTGDRRRLVLSPTVRGQEKLSDFDAGVQRGVLVLLEAIPTARHARLVELLGRIPDAGRPVPLA